MKRVLAIALGITLAGCAKTPEDPLCAAAANPASHLGERMTLSGTTRMYKRSVGLTSPACPGRGLILAMSPEDSFKSAHHETTANITFFNQVVMLLGNGASVTVTGHITPARDQADPYAFTVESGSLK